jgi:SPP1 gp7 family putative phage head morphogenesis protein
MLRRLSKLSRDMKESIVENDAFALAPRSDLFGRLGLSVSQAIPARAYEFKRTPEKVDAFMEWLKAQEKAGILEFTRRPYARIAGGFVEEPWANVFIESAYQQGIRSARTKLRAQGVDIPAFEQIPGGIGAVFNQPFHADRVGLIYSRVFEDLKTVSSVMDTQIRRRLAEGLTTGLARGMAEGKNPIQIGKELFDSLNDRVEHIGKARAILIARTEVIRAHHVANITEFRQAGIEGVKVLAEWLTAGFKVCPLCQELQTRSRIKPFTLDEIEPLLPRHPQCRCTALPVL